MSSDNYTPQGFEFWSTRSPYDTHRDWRYNTESWLVDYIHSTSHPHRDAILKELAKLEPYESILEIGCNTGPNLVRISTKKLAGIDANKESIQYAKSILPDADLRVGNFKKLPWPDKSFDVVLADAALMYINPDEILPMMEEIDRVMKKGIVIVDRFHESIKGEVTGYVWGRNYPKLLEHLGYQVSHYPITKELWPESENWSRFGIVASAHRS